MTKLFCQINSALILIFLSSELKPMLGRFQLENVNLFSALIPLFAFGITFFCIFSPILEFRIAQALLVAYSYFSYFEDIGKVSHGRHALIFSSIALVFIRLDRTLSSKWNSNSILLVQTYILASYFNSGFWKARTLFLPFSFDDITEKIQSDPLNHIALKIIEGHGPIGLIRDNLESPAIKMIISFGFLLIFLLQLFSFLPLLKRQLIPIWGCFLIFFHVSTDLFLGIAFTPFIAVISVYFLLFESFQRNEAMHTDLVKNSFFNWKTLAKGRNFS